MTSIPCNIVMIPSSDTTNDMILLSEQLKGNNTHFTLKEGAYYPHATLYMAQINTDMLDEVGRRLLAIAQNTAQITMTPKEYHQDWGYLGVAFARESLSDKLQMDVVNAINPIRDGLRDRDKERLKLATGRERENIEQYGYRSIDDLFAPHITITRFKSREDIDTTKLKNINDLTTRFTKIGVFEMGDNGTCIRQIMEFNLGKI